MDEVEPQISLFALARATFPVFLLVAVMVVMPRFVPMPILVFHGLGAVILTLIAFSAHRAVLLDQRGMAAFSSEARPALLRFGALTIALWFGMRLAAGKLQLFSSGLNENAYFIADWQDVTIFVVALIAALWLFSKFALAIPATALGEPLAQIRMVGKLSNTQVFARALIQVVGAFMALAIVGVSNTHVERADISLPFREASFMALFAAREIIIALWAIAASGVLASIYRNEFPRRRQP